MQQPQPRLPEYLAIILATLVLGGVLYQGLVFELDRQDQIRAATPRITYTPPYDTTTPGTGALRF